MLVDLRTTDPMIERVGGLLSPPVGRVDEDVVPLVFDEAVAERLRRTPGALLGAAFSFLLSFSVSGSTPEVMPAASSPESTSMGDSSASWISSLRSVTSFSGILNIVRNLSLKPVMMKYILAGCPMLRGNYEFELAVGL